MKPTANNQLCHNRTTPNTTRNFLTSLTLVLAAVVAMECRAQDEIVIADFEGPDYGNWTVSGSAFGSAPARGTLRDQNTVSQFKGQGLVNTFLGKDQSTGSLESPPFKITRNYLTFLIGGGNLPDQLGLELLVNGKRVRFQSGINDEKLAPKFWNVAKLKGKSASLRIFDRATGGWGHINVDHIVLTDELPFQTLRLSEYRKSSTYYREKYRPQFHFTPEMNWMNDPNGLVFFEGEYHLFYQHNPHGNDWGHMSWGHAVSKDLVNWEHLPIALHEEYGVMVFSGCCVIDWKNTSGFGKKGRPPMVAVFTGHGYGNQTQDLAYSNDRGRTWTKYKHNPVLDIRNPNFRDPKVFWSDQSNQWIMLISLAAEKKLQFYGSPDLKKWTWLSDFENAGVKQKSNWECPDLFRLPIDNEQGKTKWVLEADMGSGSIAGGSGGEYFVGEFDGKRFVCDDPAKKSQWVDFGRDFYAPVSFSDIPARDGRRIWLGWMNNWETCLLPTRRWRSAMSIPRTLSLRRIDDRYVLIQTPVKELNQLRQTPFTISQPVKITGQAAKSIVPEKFLTQRYELDLTVDVSQCQEFGLWVRASPKSTTEKTIIGYDAKNKRLFVDRSRSGETEFHPKFPGRHDAPLKLKDGKLKLRIFVDTSSVEVFANDGQVVFTERIFPKPQSLGLHCYAADGQAVIESFQYYPLESIWNRKPN